MNQFATRAYPLQLKAPVVATDVLQVTPQGRITIDGSHGDRCFANNHCSALLSKDCHAPIDIGDAEISPHIAAYRRTTRTGSDRTIPLRDCPRTLQLRLQRNLFFTQRIERGLEDLAR